MLTPREKSPLPEKFSPEEDQTHNAASSRTASPTHCKRAIPAPDQVVQIECSMFMEGHEVTGVRGQQSFILFILFLISQAA